MMESAKSWARHDPTRSRTGNSAGRCLLGKAKMRAVFVMVADVFREQPFKMVFIKSDDVIQQVAAAAANPALRDAILPWASEGSLNWTNAQKANSDRDFQPILSITIEDEEPRSRLKRKRLTQLLNDPEARGMVGDIEVQNTAAIVADDEKAVEHAEVDRGNSKEIHRGNSFLVVTQKGKPVLARPRILRRTFHPAGNGSFRDIKTEHEKFTVDAGSSPGSVLGHHLENQIANFLGY